MLSELKRADEALRILLEIVQPMQRAERIAVQDSDGRVLFEPVASAVNLPAFYRAAMDGFAVRSADTRGASPTNPVYLRLGTACEPVRTGMAVEDRFDAVVMLEDAQQRIDQVEVTAQVHPLKNISRIGEDISSGEEVLGSGHKMRPPDIALLAALGIEDVCVCSRPRISIIPTGGELVAIGERPLFPGEAYEICGLMAGLYIEKWGGIASIHDIVLDDPNLIRRAIESCLNSDMIILIGGTSVGKRDYAPGVLEGLGSLLVHGVRVQPGKPIAFGSVECVPVICLPGYPVATLVDLYLFVRPALKKMAHQSDAAPKAAAKLSRKISSKAGYLGIVRVKLKGEFAEPIMTSGAGILSSVARADGFVIVSEELEGIEAGKTVDVLLIE